MFETRGRFAGKRKELQGFRDRARDLELESQRPNAEDSPLTRKIRMLENRLDKAMIKYNEAQSIRLPVRPYTLPHSGRSNENK